MKAVYLDYNATTPLAPEVLSKMMPYFQEHFGNAASVAHPWGWQAETAVQNSRVSVAKLINAQTSEVFFTSGATESNNWVVRGLIDQWCSEEPDCKIHLITSPVEHSSILNSFSFAATLPNVSVSYAEVDHYGRVIVASVQKLIRPETRLLSFMWTNNELGTMNPIQELAQLAHQHKIYFHSDATQAVGKVPIDLGKTMVDLMSFSGHKIYGPKGVGALYIRNRHPKVQIAPLLHGGSHEKGLRSGTLNVPGIVGLAAACELCFEKLSSDQAHYKKLGQFLQAEIQRAFPNCLINTHPQDKSPNTLNVTFRDHNVPAQLAGIAVSRGSACQSGSMSGSHILKFLNLGESDALKTVRFSIGRPTTEEEIKWCVEKLREQILPINFSASKVAP